MTNNTVYTGIGSRETPILVLQYFYIVAAFLATKGFELRSGGAPGADDAFEKGCDTKNGRKEIYLPWKGFNGSNSNLIVRDSRAFEIAKKYHPRYNGLSDYGKLLMVRNSHQVLGWDLVTPTDFILCSTQNGSGKGGTGQAIRIAKDYNIPIFDAGKYYNLDETKIHLKQFLLYNTNLTEDDFIKR